MKKVILSVLVSGCLVSSSLKAEEKQECLIEYPVCITSTGAIVTAAVGLVSTVLLLTCGKKTVPAAKKAIPAKITLRIPANNIPSSWFKSGEIPAQAVRSHMLLTDSIRADVAAALKTAYGVDQVPEHVTQVTFQAD